MANPYNIPILEEKVEAHQKSLEEALKEYRAPFKFHINQALSFDGPIIGMNVSSKVFNDVVTLVLAILECGYYQVENPIPLGATDWARLACATLAATGHGYTKQYKHSPEEAMEKVYAESTNPSPLSQSHPTLFHHLAATAEHLKSHASSDIKLYQTWFSSIKAGLYEKASEATAIKVQEVCKQWRARKIEWCSPAMKSKIADTSKKKNHSFFYAATAELGLHPTYKGPFDNVPILMPSTTANKPTSNGTGGEESGHPPSHTTWMA
ncbi:hypothetical protein BJV74DRAFT_795448 [Russula compacta]|nr:hypothetical protein BJV74DRAFT_795448 [Russula compacta]